MSFDAEFGRNYEKLSLRSIIGYELIFQMANGFLQDALPESADILVIGAGGGKEIVTFGSANPGWKFFGVDPAAQMIAFAQHKAEQAGLQERVQLLQGFAQDMPADLRFDAATCILIFPFVHGDEAKLGVLREIWARLKPGAPLVIVAVCGDEGMRDDFRAIWRGFQAENGGRPDQIDVTEANIRNAVEYIPEARLLELTSQAGFTNAVRFFSAIWFTGWFVWKQTEARGETA